METETRELKVWETFLVYLFLALLTVSSIVVLVVYFTKATWLGDSRNDRITMGFLIGVLICLVIAAVATWRAHSKPSEEDEDEEDEEVADEEE